MSSNIALPVEETATDSGPGKASPAMDSGLGSLGSGSSGSISSSVVSGVDALSLDQKKKEERYKMDHPKRGHCLIVNNMKFDSRLNLGDRPGSEIDAENVKKAFLALGFDVKVETDQTFLKMLRHVQAVAKYDHRDCDCFVMVILSHGDEGVIYGTDGYIKIEFLVAPLKGDNCPSLIGKPKLFFFQACRGKRLDEGVEKVEMSDAVGGDEDDGDKKSDRIYRLPIEADFLFAFSVPAGYYAFRHSTRGSWFIQALTRALEEVDSKTELQHLLLRVNYDVAYNYQSVSKTPEHSGKKQVPSVVSMLTKQLYFTKKK